MTLRLYSILNIVAFPTIGSSQAQGLLRWDIETCCLGLFDREVATLLIYATSADIGDLIKVDKLPLRDYHLVDRPFGILKVAVNADFFRDFLNGGA